MYTTILIILVIAVAALLAYILYGRFTKDKKRQDPRTYIDGLKSLLDGRDQEAFARFREVVSEDTNNIDSYLRIGSILRKYGKPDKALQIHQDLTIRHDLTKREKSQILEELAKDFIKMNDLESAKSALKELIEVDDSSKWAGENLLAVYTKSEDWDSAYQMKERLIKIENVKTKAPLAIYKFFQGVSLFEKKEYHKARIIFKEAINLDNGCVPAYISIGDSYLSENRVDDAVAIWRKMIQMVPEEAHLVLNRLKKALFEIGKFGEISDVCHEILAKSPKNLEANLTLADYHSKKGEDNIAIEILNRAFDDHPDSRRPAIHLAKLYNLADDKANLGKLIARLVEKFQISEKEFHCAKCEYKSKTKLWLCPECKSIDTFKI